MNRSLYTLLYYLLLPAVFIRLLWRARQAPDYARRWGERLGFFKAPERTGGLWLHSVSVGETIAAAPLIKQIQQAYPDLPIVITTMTPTGSDRVRALFGDSVFHVYVPYDIPGAVKRFLAKTKPKATLVMETELWPNLIHYCFKQKVPVVVANARLSERSARGYGRFPALVKDMLSKVSLIAAQSSGDGERLVSLGLDSDKLQITGSVKFDIRVPEEVKQRAGDLRLSWGNGRLVWIAASTHEGEDAQVLDAYQQLLADRPEMLLVLVPRHPERFGQVVDLCLSRGLSIARRSLNEKVDGTTQVLVGDTMGELLLLYAASDMAFVGGTLVETGGHNFLEPAALALPVFSGPHLFNFTEVSRMLLGAGAMKTVENSDQLASAIRAALDDRSLSRSMGQAGLAVVEDNRGAQQRVFELIRAFL